MIKILDFIILLRNSDSYIEDIYSKGGCYQFHLILKRLYPKCEAYIREDGGHVVTLYNGICYDITGIVNMVGRYREMTQQEHDEARTWSFANRCCLKIMECPNCEEPIVYSKE
jgi:hypothetical protein